MRIFLTLLLCLAALPLAAADSGIGSFSGWRAFRFIEKGNHVCYMVAHPIGGAKKEIVKEAPKETPVKGKGNKAKKPAPPVIREAWAMLTFRPAESMAPVFTYNAGTGLKDGAAVALVAGKEKFTLFSAGNAAWARTSSLDQAIAKALRKPGKLQVTAITAKDSALRDSFDLKGAEQAYKKIATACGIAP